MLILVPLLLSYDANPTLHESGSLSPILMINLTIEYLNKVLNDFSSEKFPHNVGKNSRITIHTKPKALLTGTSNCGLLFACYYISLLNSESISINRREI